MDDIRRIMVRLDFESSGLWEDENRYLEIDPHDLNLPEDLIGRLDKLVRDFDPLLPLPQAQLDTPEIRERIRAIDVRGVELTREISKFLGNKYHIRYYSEGLRKYIDIGGKSKGETASDFDLPKDFLR